MIGKVNVNLIETKKVTKAIKFDIGHNPELRNILLKFRDLINLCIKIGLEKGISSKFRLIKEVYQEAKKFGFHSHYTHGACEVASVILKNYRRAKRKKKDVKKPEAKKLFMKLENLMYKLIEKEDSLYLRIPTKPRKFLYIKLKYGNYQKKFLEDKTLKMGSVTITPNHVIIAFSKEVKLKKPKRVVAIDVNEENITCVSSDGIVKVYDLKKVKTIRHGYYLKRKSIQKNVKCRRLRNLLLRKYSGKEKRKIEWILHNVAKQIIKDFPDSEFVLENLKNIREKTNKRKLKKNKYNGKIQPHRVLPRKLLRRLNTWSFRKLQTFIEYKALWDALPVDYVDAHFTSSLCPICGYRVEPNGHRILLCKNCGLMMDRDILACLNILKMRGVWFRPDSPTMTSTSYEGGGK